MATENKYLKSKIYKLTSELTDKFYIGSTVQLLSKRKGHHLEWFYRNQKPTSACEIIKLNPKLIKLELLESYPCNSNYELRMKEQEYLDRFREDPNLLNKCRAFISKEEYKEYKKLYMREYRKRKSQSTSQEPFSTSQNNSVC